MASQISADHKTAAFQSQEDWLQWISGTRSADLKRVRTLALRLVNVDMTGLLDPHLTAPRSHVPGSPNANQAVKQLFQNKLTDLDRGLAAMPSLSQIRIIPARDSLSHYTQGLYLSFLKLIPRRFPQLRRLELGDTNEVLQTIPELKNLPEVVFLAPPAPAPPANHRTIGSTASSSSSSTPAARQYRPGDSSSGRPATMSRTYARNID